MIMMMMMVMMTTTVVVYEVLQFRKTPSIAWFSTYQNFCEEPQEMHIYNS